jgi:hypothetical protein
VDFIDHLRALSSRVAANKDKIQTEEATKNAMVMPLIQILGKRTAAPPSQLANGLLERRGSSASIFEFRQVGN